MKRIWKKDGIGERRFLLGSKPTKRGRLKRRAPLRVARPGEWFVVSADVNHMLLHKHTFAWRPRSYVVRGVSRRPRKVRR